MQYRAHCLDGGAHTVAALVKLPFLKQVIAQHLVARHIALLDGKTRILFGGTLGIGVKDVETVEHIAHVDFILVGKHFSAIEILVS